jgi:hypothetical protein
MIRSRMVELRRERAQAQASAGSADDLMTRPTPSHRFMPRETGREDEHLSPRSTVRRFLG